MTAPPQPEDNGAVRRLLRLLGDENVEQAPVLALTALVDQLAAAAREEVRNPFAAASAALARLALAAASGESEAEAAALAGGLIVFTEVARAWPHGRP